MITLATLLVATVDAKIYERCELARKLENAGLNGFKGYTVGDCKIPAAPRLISQFTPFTQTLSPFEIFHLFWTKTQSFPL